VRPLGGAHGAVPRQEVRKLHSLNHQIFLDVALLWILVMFLC
jgi:hypothetical protein